MLSNVVPAHSHYDAIIVGARCAGASTAMLLSRAGLRVLAVDRQSYGSDTLSTHALMRPAVMQLSRWGLLQPLIQSGAPVIRSTTFHYGEQEVTVPIRPEPDIPGLMAPRRTVLDRMLVDAARAAGATIMHDTPVHDLMFDAHRRVRGVIIERCRRPNSRDTAPISWLEQTGSARLSLARSRHGRWCRGGARWHMSSATPRRRRSRDTTGISAGSLSGGVIPTNDGLACIVASVPTERFDAEFRFDLSAAQLALAALAPGLGSRAFGNGGERLKAFRGTPGRLRQAYGPGWMLVGDAGFFRDPLTSHGISDALRDAEGATTAILSCREVRIAGVPGSTRQPRAAHS